ncbi:MAG: transcription termination factor NusA [Bacilli bacterium]|nr:transcription termination factor NusA [Bacilli bacterium]
MAKKQVETIKFVDALRDVADTKGLSDEAVIGALEEAIVRAYIKFLGGGDDAVVTCHVDPETGKVDLAQIKKVVKEDDIEDDYLQISPEDAKEISGKKPKIGDEFAIPCPVEDISKITAMAIRTNFRVKLAEAERTALYKVYKDHIGEMMVGTVEKADDRNVTVMIGRTSIELTRHELIGDEYFRVGDQIKVYIQEVRTANVDGKPDKGPQIQATRSSEGFLKRLFEEEIHEIYEGTVLIKAIARKAGVRSKVAVASLNEDIDATGACIGQGGSRIQRIVSQLGNGKGKEKIDVVNYSDNAGLFILESVRPVQALGVLIHEEDKTATVVIRDGDLPLGLGKSRANIDLAGKLTGYKLEIIEEAKANALGVEFIPAADIQHQAEEEKKLAERAALIRKTEEEAARRAEEAAKKKAAEEEAKRLAEEEAARVAAEEAAKKAEEEAEEAPAPEKPVEKVSPKASARPEDFPLEATNPAAAALRAVELAKQQEAAKKAEEEAAAAAAASEEPAEEETPAITDVKTTTTLADLEAGLSASSSKKSATTSKKRPRKITEDEVKHDVAPTVSSTVNAMPVYTEEELNEIEAEENAAYDDLDDDVDYSEYDQYYDDDGK